MPAAALRSSFPEDLLTHPRSVYASGDCREVVNLLLYALASTIDSKFFWLDIGDALGPASSADPVQLGWVEPSRHYTVAAPEMVAPERSNPALWKVIRADEPSEEIAGLVDFLRLPSITQEIASRAVPGVRPAVLAAANTDRASRLYPATAEGIHPFIRAITDHGISLIVGHTGPALPNRLAFEFVFRVEATSLPEWTRGTFVCESGIRSGPLRIGRTQPIKRVPWLVQILERASAGSS
jgi:hypothetical protein